MLHDICRSSASAKWAACFAASLLVATGGVVGAQGPATAAATGRYLDPIFSSVHVDNDLVYGHVDHGGGDIERLRLDLYRPVGDTKKNRPVVIFVHGGSSDVDKSAKRNRTSSIAFAKRGFVAAAIAYRDGTSGGTQGAQYDTRAAVRWFKANATRLGVNPSKITLMGSSAGAINVLNVAFHPEDPGDSGHPAYPSTVAAAISVSGYASEPQNIGPGEAPIAMFHADDDKTIPIATAQATCAQTKSFGNVCTFYEYAEGGHPPGFLRDNMTKIVEQSSRFLCRQVIGLTACHDANGDGVVDS